MTAPALVIARPEFFDRPGLAAIVAAIGAGRFVGGAVRDTLLGRAAGDLDLATPLTPDAVTRRLVDAGIKAIPTGIAHGTVTAVVGETRVEITTLRRDVETDGRHAVVAFTEDWAADAARRDFTMNALYLDADSGVWDPLGTGLADCRAGAVRFIGDPAARIDEDVLRLLRFYRFQATHGRQALDEAGRAACRAALARLDRLPGERVAPELFKLLAAPEPIPTLAALIEDGVAAALLPAPLDPARLGRLLAFAPESDGLLRLAALLPARTAHTVAARLRLSNAETERLAALLDPMPIIDFVGPARLWRQARYRLGPARFRDRVLIEATAGTGSADAVLLEAERWPVPVLPIDGSDAIEAGFEPGPALGRALAAIEDWWAAGDFTADRAGCLDRLAGLHNKEKTP